MNNKKNMEIIKKSLGERLKEERHKMGLTKSSIAEKLYLKKSIIQDIEKNRINPNLHITFLRGYIRSYARLINFPKKELIELMDRTQFLEDKKPSKISSFSNKKKDNEICLIRITWLFLITFLFLSVLWWCYHQKKYYSNKNFLNEEVRNQKQKKNSNLEE